jgi:adenosylcobyric acid synthase
MAALMIQGCGSDVGKSVLVAGLCRLFTNRGITVRPFKPQNMSNNAAVTADGGEIGRAQALQAFACRVPATVDMNPVLLKPQSDVGAQVIVRGQMQGTQAARDYQARKADLLHVVCDSYRRIAAESELVLIEGAGSPAEINLRVGDIANMGFARAMDVPVVLVGDIDRGHVIAALVGAHAVLAPEDRGFIINKFRGDPALFVEGRAEIAHRTGWRDYGMVPWLLAVRRLPAEDAVVLEHAVTDAAKGKVKIVVPMLARMANFDDFDPLAAEPSVDFRFVPPGTALPGDADWVILPGTKATVADLAFLRDQGWDIDLAAHLRRGGRVLGICGGYQMLGRTIADPQGIEGAPGNVEGLGYLNVDTALTGEKVLTPVSGTLSAENAAFDGYEMHVGRTAGADLVRPFAAVTGREPDGAISADGRVAGTYIHGLFSRASARAAVLAPLGAASAGMNHPAAIDALLDEIADHLAQALDVAGLAALAGLSRKI